jgi:hypothetical protein
MEDKRDYKGIIIPYEILTDERLTSTAKTVFGLIHGLSYKSGYCWATTKYLSDELKKSHATIERAIKSLIDINVMSIEHHNRRGVYVERHIIIEDSLNWYVDKLNKNGIVVPLKNDIYSPSKMTDSTLKNEGQYTNNTNTNNTNKTISKDIGAKAPSPQHLLNNFRELKKPKSKESRYKIMYQESRYKIMYHMILEFTNDLELRKSLGKYLSIILAKNRTPDQFKMMLADLYNYTNKTPEAMQEKVDVAYMGGYNILIPQWEKDKFKNNQSSFDNTASRIIPKAVNSMTPQEKQAWENGLEVDEFNNLVVY